MPPHHCKDFHIEMLTTGPHPQAHPGLFLNILLLFHLPHCCLTHHTHVHVIKKKKTNQTFTISVSTIQSPSTARWCQLKFSSTMRSSSKFNSWLLDPLPGEDSKPQFPPTIRKGPLSAPCLTVTCLLGWETYNMATCLFPSQMENL